MTHLEKLLAAKKMGFSINGRKKSTYESVKEIAEKETHPRNKDAKKLIEIIK